MFPIQERYSSVIGACKIRVTRPSFVGSLDYIEIPCSIERNQTITFDLSNVKSNRDE